MCTQDFPDCTKSKILDSNTACTLHAPFEGPMASFNVGYTANLIFLLLNDILCTNF